MFEKVSNELRCTMKKSIIGILVILLSLGIAAPALAESNMQDVEPTPESTSTPQPEDEDVYNFPLLGFTETRLIGPFDSTSVQVSFPEEWTFPSGGRLYLEYNLSIYGDDVIEGQGLDGGVLDISVNDTIVDSISLRLNGDYSQNIIIPADVLVSDRTDGRMSIDFDLISEESCTWDFDVNLIIREASYLYLPHSLTSPTVDLTLLPRPFYQPSSLFERTAILVLPEDPTTAELQAGMDVAAGFGSLTGSNLILQTVIADELTTTVRNAENLIFVGKAASLSVISSLDLPVGLQGDSFPLEDDEDGLLQMVISPWNTSRVVLLVTGNNDAGVIKAGQALKYGTILTTSTLNNAAEVEAYRTEASSPLIATDRTLADLGYEDRNLRSSGTNNSYFEFYIPPGQTVSDEAFLDLHFTHSSLINYNTSGLTVTLNNRVVGSVSFTNETAQYTEVQLNLPPSAFIQGTNDLVIQVQLIPYDNCTDVSNFISTWATIFSDSYLHLPLVEDTSTVEDDLSMTNFPENIASGDVQGNITFVLPESDPVSWRSAAAIAFKMGDQLDDSLSQINVQFQNDLDEEQLANRNVVLIGRPSKLSMLYDWSTILPAPFQPGSEIPYDPASRVVYRVVEGSEVGYVELFVSPWGTDKLAMLVSGNSDNGLSLAGSALSGGDFRGSLAGNFAIISSGQIISLDTRYPVSSEYLGTETAVVETQVEEIQRTQIQQEHMSWMIPAIFIITLMTLAVILIKLLPTIRSSKQGKDKGSDE